MERIKKDKEEGEEEGEEKGGEKKKKRRRCRGNGRGESVLHIDEFTTRSDPTLSLNLFLLLPPPPSPSSSSVSLEGGKKFQPPNRGLWYRRKVDAVPLSFSVLRIGQSAPSVQFHPSILDLLLQWREREIYIYIYEGLTTFPHLISTNLLPTPLGPL